MTNASPVVGIMLQWCGTSVPLNQNCTYYVSLHCFHGGVAEDSFFCDMTPRHWVTGSLHFYTPVFLQNVTNYPVMQHHIPQKWSLLYLQQLKTKNPKYKHSEFLFWPTVRYSDTAAQLPVHSFSRMHWSNFTKCFNTAFVTLYHQGHDTKPCIAQ